jgi:hypothetical protein
MSHKWSFVPSRQDKAYAAKEAKRAKVAAERGEDYEMEVAKANRERDRRDAIEAAARIAADEREAQARAAKAQRKADEKATQQRRTDAIERSRRAADPKLWVTCVEQLESHGAELAGELEGLFDEEAYPMLAGSQALRLEYAMAVVDRATAFTTLPSASTREPAATFVASLDNGAARDVMRAIEQHLEHDDMDVGNIVHLCAAYFGSKGAKVTSHGKGDGLGARLVLQLALRHYAEVVATNADVFAAFFFQGAGSDANSAAYDNLRFVLDQLVEAAQPDDLRNAVVSLCNSAEKFAVPEAGLHKLSPWFHAVALALRKTVAEKNVRPLLFSPGAALLLLAAVPDAVSAELLVQCGAQWHPKAASHIAATVLKRVATPTDQYAHAMVSLIAAEPAVASQLSTSFGTATKQVNAVLEALTKAKIGLPKQVSEDITAKARSALGGKGRAANVEAYSATAGLLKGVGTARNATAGRGSKAHAHEETETEAEGHVALRVLVAVAIVAAGIAAFWAQKQQ